MTQPVEDLKIALHESWVRVEFTKVDGTHRSMLCTLNFADIASSHTPKGSGKKENPNIISVFDLDKQDWRSIRSDSIKSWTVERTVTNKE